MEETSATPSGILPTAEPRSSATRDGQVAPQQSPDTVFKVVMVRSGEHEWAMDNLYCGWYDAKLTLQGRRQVTQASEILQTENYSFDLAYCSVLSRCIESLDIILNKLDLKDIEKVYCWNLNERHCGALTVSISNDLEKRICEAFEVFDHTGTRTVDVREIGTIIRGLGCIPTEAEIQEILVATENAEASGTVTLTNFLPHMVQVFSEHKYQPAPADKLLEAFQTLDPEGLGYVTKEYLTKLMMEEGEPFTQEEVDEMLVTACDPQTQLIPYEYYINHLMHEPSLQTDLYKLADIIGPRPKDERRKTMRQIIRMTQKPNELKRMFNID